MTHFHLKDNGLTHINVAEDSSIKFGRWLSPFTECDIDTLIHGKFKSIEGYYHFLVCTMTKSDIAVNKEVKSLLSELHNSHGLDALHTGMRIARRLRINFNILTDDINGVIREHLIQATIQKLNICDKILGKIDYIYKYNITIVYNYQYKLESLKGIQNHWKADIINEAIKRIKDSRV